MKKVKRCFSILKNQYLSFKKKILFSISEKPQHPKIHIGPGRDWIKPSNDWLTLDIDPARADVIVSFNVNFRHLPLNSDSVLAVYGSHVFEHISVSVAPTLFKEIYRVLVHGGYFRIVIPDARKSIEQYLSSNKDFPLFVKRHERAKRNYGLDYTIFECMREDFISKSGQEDLLGRCALAHQNAWDFETIMKDLVRAGFNPKKIQQKHFQETDCSDFAFEGTYPSEANEDYRSLYIEVTK